MQRPTMRTTVTTNYNHIITDHPVDAEEEKYAKSQGRLSWSDRLSIVVLLVLYTLQGIPMGLCGSIPMILKDKGVSYEALSLFSLVSLPFSMKIIWAPLVDSYYIASFGRRKTWLVPVQLLTGLMMILGASHMQHWLRDDVSDSSNKDAMPDTWTLTLFFFVLYLLMATQDIAVDGWALTMLSRDNVGLASACNAFGQSLGVFLSNQGLIALSDENWCIRHLATNGALVTLPSFMVAWGWIFIITTAIVGVFKREDNSECLATSNNTNSSGRNKSLLADETATNNNNTNNKSALSAERLAYQQQFPHNNNSTNNTSNNSSTDTNDGSTIILGSEAELPGLQETIRQIALLCQLPSIRSFLFVLFTARVGVAVVDGAFTFKLQEYGFSKTTLATLAPATLLVSFLAPVFAGHSVARQPLHWLYSGLCVRLVLALLLWCLLQYTARVYGPGNDSITDTPLYFLTLILLVCNEAASSIVFLAQMSFFNQVSDPSIGGSYMTLLNTAANLGSKWPSVLFLYLLPKLTFASCVHPIILDDRPEVPDNTDILDNNSNHNDYNNRFLSFAAKNSAYKIVGVCRSLHDTLCPGRCVMHVDGYTLLTAAGLVVGALWLYGNRSRLFSLQARPHSDWLVSTAEKLQQQQQLQQQQSVSVTLDYNNHNNNNINNQGSEEGDSSKNVVIGADVIVNSNGNTSSSHTSSINSKQGKAH